MATPQHGIFALGTRAHHHLQLDVAPSAPPGELLAALRAIREAATTVRGVNVVIGLGPDLCRRILPGSVPEGVAAFEALRSEGVEPPVEMPADQHDLWLWFHGATIDPVFDAVRAAAGRLGGLATVVREQPSFTYQSSQDLTGFEDGTENPPIDEAAEAAVVPEGSPGAGGSVALLQRWVHDLDGFEQLDHDAQCQVFGRDKVTNEELPDDVRSPRSHISRVVIDDDEGEELEIFRRSTAYGGVLEHGLVFVGFSADRERLSRMLDRMVGADDGISDRLTDFSRAVESAWYVVPSIEALAEAGSDA